MLQMYRSAHSQSSYRRLSDVMIITQDKLRVFVMIAVFQPISLGSVAELV